MAQENGWSFSNTDMFAATVSSSLECPSGSSPFHDEFSSIKNDLERFIPCQFHFSPEIGQYVPVFPVESCTFKEGEHIAASKDCFSAIDRLTHHNIEPTFIKGELSQDYSSTLDSPSPHNLESTYTASVKEEPPEDDSSTLDPLSFHNFEPTCTASVKAEPPQEVTMPPSASKKVPCIDEVQSIGPQSLLCHLLDDKNQIKQQEEDIIDCHELGVDQLAEDLHGENSEEKEEIMDCHIPDDDYELAEGLYGENSEVNAASQLGEQAVSHKSGEGSLTCVCISASIQLSDGAAFMDISETPSRTEHNSETVDTQVGDTVGVNETIASFNRNTGTKGQEINENRERVPAAVANPYEAERMVQEKAISPHFRDLNHHRVYYNGDGYYYTVNKRRPRGTFLACTMSSKCPGRGSMPSNPSERLRESLRITRAHSHPPDHHWIKAMVSRGRILDRCRTESTSFDQIVQEELEGLGPEITKYSELTLKSLKQYMYRVRKYKFNKYNFTPSDLQSFGEFLESNQRFGFSESNKPFYRATVKDEGDNAALIFVSETLSEVLSKASDILVDATFKIVPSSPLCHHLLIVAPVYQDLVLPTVYVLMERKTEFLYQLVFTFLKQTFPQLRPEVFISDYDRLLQNTLRQTWPTATVVGSWCHTANCMVVKANHLGLFDLLWANKAANQVFKKCQALPFLPPHMIREGYEHIVKFAECTGVLQKLVVFLSYIHNVWVKGVGVESLSVYRQQKRTLNIMEAFHRKLMDCFKKPPPTIWAFTDGVRNMESRVISTLDTKGRLYVFTRGPMFTSKKDDRILFNLTSDLVRGVIGIGEFLDAVSRLLEGFHNKAYNCLEYDNSDDEHMKGLEVSSIPPDTQDPMLLRKKLRKKKRHWRKDCHRAKSDDETHCKKHLAGSNLL